MTKKKQFLFLFQPKAENLPEIPGRTPCLKEKEYINEPFEKLLHSLTLDALLSWHKRLHGKKEQIIPMPDAISLYPDLLAESSNDISVMDDWFMIDLMGNMESFKNKGELKAWLERRLLKKKTFKKIRKLLRQSEEYQDELYGYALLQDFPETPWRKSTIYHNGARKWLEQLDFADRFPNLPTSAYWKNFLTNWMVKNGWPVLGEFEQSEDGQENYRRFILSNPGLQSRFEKDSLFWHLLAHEMEQAK